MYEKREEKKEKNEKTTKFVVCGNYGIDETTGVVFFYRYVAIATQSQFFVAQFVYPYRIVNCKCVHVLSIY